MPKPRKTDEVDKLIEWFLIESTKYNKNNPFGLIVKVDKMQVGRRIRSLIARREKRRLKSAYEQGLDCRIHGKRTKYYGADCSFEKCFLNNPLYQEKK